MMAGSAFRRGVGLVGIFLSKASTASARPSWERLYSVAVGVRGGAGASTDEEVAATVGGAPTTEIAAANTMSAVSRSDPYQHLRGLEDALEVTQRLIDQVDDHFGRKHGVYGSALSDMALMMKSVGRHDEATEIYLKALEVYRAVYKGEENASYAHILHNLGMTFRAMADESKKLERIPLMERAAESFERCVQIREKLLPNNHPDLQLARSRLAMVQGHLGAEKGRTEARLRAALDGLEMAVGKENASTANAMTNLALFLKGDGQYAEATELYTTVLETRKKLYGPKHYDVLVSMHNLSMVHQAAGREDEAVQLQEEISKIGEEMGMTAEEQSEASRAAEGTAGGPGGAVKLARGEGNETRSARKENKRDNGNSGSAWKPMQTRDRRKSKRRK